MTSSSLCRLRHKTQTNETGKGEKTWMGGGVRGIVDGEGHCRRNKLFKARRGRHSASDDVIRGISPTYWSKILQFYVNGAHEQHGSLLRVTGYCFLKCCLLLVLHICCSFVDTISQYSHHVQNVSGCSMLLSVLLLLVKERPAPSKLCSHQLIVVWRGAYRSSRVPTCWRTSKESRGQKREKVEESV